MRKRFHAALRGLASIMLVIPGLSGQAQSQTPAAKVIGSTEIAPMPLTERIRRGAVPKRGTCSTKPGTDSANGLITGNGKMWLEVLGDPFVEQVIFHHERILQPWKNTPLKAPQIASVLPEVRRLILNGEYAKGLDLALAEAEKGPTKTRTDNLNDHPAFDLRMESAERHPVWNYLRTVDFESGEVRVVWQDSQGIWERRAFVSRPDNVVVQQLKAPAGGTIDLVIRLDTDMILSHGGDAGYQSRFLREPKWQPLTSPGAESIDFVKRYEPGRVVLRGNYEVANGKPGYASATRVLHDGGTVEASGDALRVKGAQSLILITRIDVREPADDGLENDLVRGVEGVAPDYDALLRRHRMVQAEVVDRVRLDLGGAADHALSGEELLNDQRSRSGYNAALLEKLMDMGRYWLYARTGDFPPMWGQANINMNLQISSAVEDNIPESIAAYTHWLETLLPDARVNAKNIFGAQGAVFGIHPTVLGDPSDHFDYSFPHLYWISAGGWLYSPLWDYYLATGDVKFLREHIVPALKELALFYQDFLSIRDQDGKFIFVPSYSPENWPANTQGSPAVINATMDIAVARQVLTHLIEAAQTLQENLDEIPRWKQMLDEFPPYLLDEDGTLKEWAWPSLVEAQDHRHVSHLYGVWPGDEITPEGTPDLAMAALLADRKRGFGNASAHGLLHRALAAARLKDAYLVSFVLKQLLEQGYINSSLTTMHNSFWFPAPDVQGGMPTLLTEMLVYSRPGTIELLPALPETLGKGSIEGVVCRGGTVLDNLQWDMKEKKVKVIISSRTDQVIDLVLGRGIAGVEAPDRVLNPQECVGATHCSVRLSATQPVMIHFAIGDLSPFDWAAKADRQVENPAKRTIPR
jgi:hypothetical protein